MSLIGDCADCERTGVRLHKKPDVPRDEQSRPTVCREGKDALVAFSEREAADL